MQEIHVTIQAFCHGFTDSIHQFIESASQANGSVAQSYSDFGYVTIRNYFETSHAKGPQDVAGANLKHRADMAVIKRQVNARTLKNDIFPLIKVQKNLKGNPKFVEIHFNLVPKLKIS